MNKLQLKLYVIYNGIILKFLSLTKQNIALQSSHLGR